MTRTAYRNPRRVAGLTILELLVVLAILGIVGGIGIFNGRQLLANQEQRAAVTSLQQTIWQGATAAASRGTTVELVRSGRQFTLVDTGEAVVLKEFELPEAVSTNWPEGTALAFTPPGRVESLDSLPKDLWVSTSRQTIKLTISLIGEVRAEVVG